MWKCTCCETINDDEQSACIVCGKAYEVETLLEEKKQRTNRKKCSASFKVIAITIAALIVGLIVFLLSNQTRGNPVLSTVSAQEVTAFEPVYLTLNFRQIYQCSTSDFGLSGDDADHMTWSCVANDAGVTCSPDGTINAGNILIDPGLGYNEPIPIIGTDGKNKTLTYYLTTGNDQRYEFCWSGNRTMKSYVGPVYQVTPMVTNCYGFTLTFKSVLTNGDIIGDQWSVWVRENGTDWVYIQDITLQNDSECTYDIFFEREISFSEIAVQPPKQYNPYSNTVNCKITNLIMS